MIVKRKLGYFVLSEKRKNLGGPYKTRDEALKRLRQVEFFKHLKGKYNFAAEPGLEPRYHPSEGRVLPLDDSAIYFPIIPHLRLLL